jgi:putative DNA primase/helicase
MTGGGLTELVCAGEHTASKAYACQPDGKWTKTQDYNLGFQFRPIPCDCADLHELADLIETIRDGGNAFLIRGELDQAARDKLATNPDYRIARRKNPKPDGIPAHLAEAARQWIMVDIDKYPLPPDADLATDPVAAISAAIRVLLPCFHGAECFWQLSSSAGFAVGVLKVHLFYWLDKPYENADLRRWFRHFAPLVDTAPFNAVQPHYITDPKLTGGADPLPRRTGWIPGTVAEVALPDLPPETERARARDNPPIGGTGGSALHAASIADALARLGDGDGRDGFHAPLLAATLQYAFRCQKGGIRNDTKFIGDLRAAIEAAPKQDGRDVADYLGEPYLRRIIDGGFDLIAPEPDTSADGARAIELPTGFGMTETGLWFTDPTKDHDEPVWVCQQFHVIGECENGAGGDWGVVMAWRDAADHRHTWIIPRDLLHGEPHVVAGRLETQGLRCNFTKAGQGFLRRCLASLRPEHRLTAVERGGWHGMSYILPSGEMFGDSAIILRPELQRADLSCATAGSLQDWQDHVARYAVGNARLALFIATAFSGALLEIIAEPSGGMHLYGRSQSGKSTADYVAGSVNGKGARDGAVHQWRATGNGLEGIAARCSDGCLVLDEISQADAREAGDTIYMLADGQGKQRAARDGSARARANWRIMFLSTGEVTLSQRMSDANRRTMTGMEVRLVNIPADAGAGMGVFENLHNVAEPGLLADQLRDASARFYGSAGRAFLSRLVATRAADPDGFYGVVKALRMAFIRDHLPAGADGQVRSVCGRFGVIAAAGELATSWGILPWPEGEAIKAAVTCFKAWLAARGGIGAGEEQGAIRQVTAFFEAHVSRFTEIRAGITYPETAWQRGLGVKRKEPADEIIELRTINRCGWRRHDQATDHWTYYVLPEMWKSEVCKGIDSDMAARALAAKGLLERGEGRNLKKKVYIPEHGQPRLYVVSGAILDGDAD